MSAVRLLVLVLVVLGLANGIATVPEVDARTGRLRSHSWQCCSSLLGRCTLHLAPRLANQHAVAFCFEAMTLVLDMPGTRTQV